MTQLSDAFVMHEHQEDKKTYEELLSKVSAETTRFEGEEQELKKLQILMRHKLEKATTEEVERKERINELKKEVSMI